MKYIEKVYKVMGEEKGMRGGFDIHVLAISFEEALKKTREASANDVIIHSIEKTFIKIIL